MLIWCLFFALSFSASFPVWSSSWHADVTIAESSFLPLESSIPVSQTGQFYYDSPNKRSSFMLKGGFSTRTVLSSLSQWAVVSVLSTGSCNNVSLASKPYFGILPPNFVELMNFSFVGIEYYQQEGVFHETVHWQLRNASESVDYWHEVASNSAFRLQWGSVWPVIVEFRWVIRGLADVANLGFVFAAGENCSPSPSRRENHAVRQDHSFMSKNTIGTSWPLQWTAVAEYTGNDFGFSSSRGEPELGEPSIVLLSLIGRYYYDWTGQRECNFWTDMVSGERTKTLIVNGTYYLVTLATNNCLIVPISPVGGPLKYDWPTRIPFANQEWMHRGKGYLRTNHYEADVIHAGAEHSFHYWEATNTRTPLQFQGPVLDFPPYGQSMMVWSQMSTSLDGVDLNYVFSVPSHCVRIPEDRIWNLRLSPLISFQEKVSNHLSRRI